MNVREAAAVAGASPSGGIGLLTRSSSLAAIALTGLAAVVVSGVAVAKHEYNKYKSQKHLNKIKQVLKFHNEYLVDILDTGFPEHPSLPPPFILDDKDNPASATALKLNEAIRRDLVKDKSINNDSFLNQYSRHIKNAKTHILGLYDVRLSKDERSQFTRGTAEDVTSSVLTYLLVMLSEHCTKFEGYQADIVYLEGIIRFITAYASIPRHSFFESSDPKKRQRFERLKLVCKELRKAKKLLLDHSNSRTLKSYVDELMSAASKDLIPELSSFFAKFIIAEEKWIHVDSATLELLAKGLIRQEYKNSHTLLSQNEVDIPDSIFKHWLQMILAHYLNPKVSIKNTIGLKAEDLVDIKPLFKIAKNFLTLKAPQPQADGSYETDSFIPVGFDKECRVVIAAQLPTVIDPFAFLIIKEGQAWRLYEVEEDRKLLELEIAEVKGLDTILEKLSTVKKLERLSGRKKEAINAVLTAYRNLQQLKNRAQIFLDLAILLDQLTDLTIFCEKLSDFIRDMGEIYISNPHHCNFIFDSLQSLSADLHNRIGILLKALEKVEEEQDSVNDMLITKQLDLAMRLNAKLLAIREKVSSTTSGILDKHNLHNYRWGDPQAGGIIDYQSYEEDQKKKAVQEMLRATTKLVLKYKFETDKYELSEARSRMEGRASSYLSVIEDRTSFQAHRFRAASKEGTLDFQPVSEAKESESKESEADYSMQKNQERLDLGALFTMLAARIATIKQEEKPDKRTAAAYEELADSLNEFDLDAKIMQKEKDPLQQLKAEKTQALISVLCERTLNFLNEERQSRMIKAKQFKADLKTELSAPHNYFLDEHRSVCDKILRAVTELLLCFVGVGFYLAYQRGGLFRTSTRAAAYRVGSSGEKLGKRLCDSA